MNWSEHKAIYFQIADAMMDEVADGALKDHCHATNPRIPTRDEYLELLRQSR